MNIFWPFDMWYGNVIYLVGLVIYIIYGAAKTFHACNESYYTEWEHAGKPRRIHKVNPIVGIREAFFEDQTHFTLYDLIRLFFIWPFMIFTIVIIVFFEGLKSFFPFFKKILGLNLFRIKKGNEDDKS